MRTKYVPIIAAIFLVIAMMVQFGLSYHRNEKGLLRRIDFKMELAQKDVLFKVYDMSNATAELVHFLPDNGKDSTALYTLLENVLWRFPDLFSCYICYEPYHFSPKEEIYSVCAIRGENGSISNSHFEEQRNYLVRDWYIGAMRSDDNGYWTQSYNDVHTDDLVFTHSQKAYDQNDSVIGVVAVDYTLAWAKQVLMETKPYEDAVCQLYSSNGTLIVQSGETDDWDDMIISEKVMSPIDMRLVIAVPKHHLWEGMSRVSTVTLIVLLIGFLIAGLLIRRLLQDQRKFTRVETANEVMERELQIASTIQKGILREGERDKVQDNKWQDVELQAALVPMREVGGDLYDFYRRGDDLFFIIGDVSGKSITAAMFMSATVNLFRSAVLRLQSPKTIIEDMNAVLSDKNPSMMFVTAFIGRLHIPTGELLYCNAGHLPPLIARDNHDGIQIVPIPLEPNIPLGYDGKFRFVEQGMMLRKDDLLVLYTDGITEARNEKHEMLGIQRWMEIVKNNLTSLKAGRLEAIEEAGVQFTGKAEQTDDMTLMTVLQTTETQPLSLRTEPRMEQWPILKTAFHNYALCAQMDKRTIKKMEVALEEAVVNVIHYAQAEWIELKIESNDAISIQIADNGIPFDPTAQAPIDIPNAVEQRQIGGLGIALIKQIADQVQYRRNNNRNELTIIKNL